MTFYETVEVTRTPTKSNRGPLMKLLRRCFGRTAFYVPHRGVAPKPLHYMGRLSPPYSLYQLSPSKIMYGAYPPRNSLQLASRDQTCHLVSGNPAARPTRRPYSSLIIIHVQRLSGGLDNQCGSTRRGLSYILFC